MIARRPSWMELGLHGPQRGAEQHLGGADTLKPWRCPRAVWTGQPFRNRPLWPWQLVKRQESMRTEKAYGSGLQRGHMPH